MATWKEGLATSIQVEHVPFNTSRKFFAVDCSGSTFGATIKSEGAFVQKLSSNTEDRCVKWDHACTPPIIVSEIDSQSYWKENGGTEPQVILRQPSALEQIRASDTWVLITDGEVSNGQVQSLTNLANVERVMQVPVVLLVVGRQYTKSPETTNISVAIPFYAGATDAILLFKDVEDGRVYVVSAKGAFEALSASDNDGLRATWDSLRSFVNEEAFNKECASRGISVLRSQDRQTLSGVSLGPGYTTATGCLVNVDVLLQQSLIGTEDLKHLLEDEAIDRLAVVCKTWGKLDVLRSLLSRQKRQEVALRLEDRHGAGGIMEQLQNEELTTEEMTRLQDQLREAHAANRMAYQHHVNSPSDEAKEARERNRAIDRAMTCLSNVDKASYTADILSRKSNRAMRAGQVKTTDAQIHLLALDLSDEVDAFRRECSICCGEGIMSIALKKLDHSTVEEKTTDFALNFPLAAGCAARNVGMVSSQCICFQCATCALLCRNSIYKENLAAILPTVVYKDANKRYLNHQLCTAVTNGLNTGASGIAQLFMTILDRVLETKGWCQTTQGNSLNDHEQTARRGALSWMLNNFVTHTKTRESFNETGPWVAYPQALLWALDDFKESGLESWVIQYPTSGFILFIRLLERVDQMDQETSRGDLSLGAHPKNVPQMSEGPSTDRSARDRTLYRIAAMCEAKLIHLVVTAMMRALLQQRDSTWAYPFLELVYQGFNAPGVPRDLGPASVLSADKFWDKLPAILGGWQDVTDFLTMISSRPIPPQLHPQQRRLDLCRRLQLVIFWAVFTQKAHVTPKALFRTIREREPLAPTVLEGLLASSLPVPARPIMEVLTSIFWSPAASCSDPIHGNDQFIPFASPFGPSVLRCGFTGCSTKFYDENSSLVPNPDQVRQLRAQHLKEVFGSADFQSSLTGLPEPTLAPKRPTSAHCNIHSGIARVWSRMDRKKAADERPLGNLSLIDNSNALQGQLPSKEEVYKGDDRAVDLFISEVRKEVCSNSGRGDIYQTLEDPIREVLPSFFEALKVAARRSGLADGTGMDYVHDWAQNKIAAKIEYELALK